MHATDRVLWVTIAEGLPATTALVLHYFRRRSSFSNLTDVVAIIVICSLYGSRLDPYITSRSRPHTSRMVSDAFSTEGTLHNCSGISTDDTRISTLPMHMFASLVLTWTEDTSPFRGTMLTAYHNYAD
jgi:hypothetical protein